MNKGMSIAQTLLRFALAIGFILPVLDRLGLLGAPGSINVSWGNWDHFVGYASMLMPYLSQKMVSIMGGIVTAVELLLGILLIINYKLRLAALGSFALTLIFGFSMLLFTGYRSPFDYSVFSVSFGSLLLYFTLESSGLKKNKPTYAIDEPNTF